MTPPGWTDGGRGRGGAIAAGVAYLVLALIVTWPWLLDPSGVVYGALEGSDQAASIAMYEQLADDFQPPFVPGELRSLNAPEGLQVPWAVSLAGFGSAFLLWVLSVAFGAVAAHGVLAVLGYSGSAFAMFLLVRRLTRHAGIAFAVGLAFGFWTFSYSAGWTWPNYIHGWVFVLLAWRMIEVAEQPSTRNGLLAGAAAVVAMTWIQYYLLIAAVAFATMAGVGLLYARRRRQLPAQLRAQATAGGVVVLAVAAIGGLSLLADFDGAPVRESGDAYVNSARPLMYLLPGPRHPLFGGSVGDWVQEKYPLQREGSSETATYQEIYLGIAILLLALRGGWLVLRRRAGPLTGVGVAAIATVFVGLAFSAPPKIAVAGLSLPMPYAVVNEVTTVFRVASRFSMLVMLGLCVLAAIALVGFMARRRPVVQALLIAVVVSVVAVDGWARPDPSTEEVTHAPIYDVLARQPAGIVAEYPLGTSAYVQGHEALAQPVHGQRLFSGWDDGSLSAVHKLALRDLDDPLTPGSLRAFGVRYVIAHDRETAAGGVAAQVASDAPGLRLIARRRGGALYRVVAPPARFLSIADQGFLPPEGSPPGVHWTGQPAARLRLQGRCAPCAGTLSFGSGTFARPRRLSVVDPAGRTVARRMIGSASVPVAFHVRFDRLTALRFVVDPPPDRIDDFLHNGDTRRFGVFMALPVRFVADRRAGHRWIEDR